MSEARVVWLPRERLLPAALREIRRPEVLLDIGCGIAPQRYVRPLVHVCCEPFGQYVSVLRARLAAETDRCYIVLQATWAQAVEMFPEGAVDSVFLIDVIEHVEKVEAMRLLEATARIARRQVVLFTPLGFMPQSHPDGRDAWGLDGGHWQEHKSGWQPEDFDAAWTILAARDYYRTDNLGRPLEKPFGAMWAIRNASGTAGAARVAGRLRLAAQMGAADAAALAARVAGKIRRACGRSG